ncbi:uncharacterized protein LOC136033183 isoform X1 [Artemia franciscana]|uniref:uncharacterized protein LOC136033183 isoform X1 n=1 Tax=Artemia franciscana TaxID=6661 RepID=UPI0032DB386A
MNGAKVGFFSEIEKIMHGFGDVPNPLRMSVELMENLIKKELNEIIREAETVAEFRMSSKIDIEEIVFLLRRNKFKLRRIYKCLETKALGSKIEKDASEEIISQRNSKNERNLIHFVKALEELDTFGDLVDFCKEEGEPDLARVDRLLRLEKVSRDLDSARYEAFAKARTIRFSCAKQKFAQWALSGSELSSNITELAWLALDFLAFEAIGQAGLTCAGLLGKPLTPDEISEAYRRLTTRIRVCLSGHQELLPKCLLI